jgi:biopolymer transport protein TolR
MLVLLVIFMVTAPLINPGQIELPSVGSKLSTPVSPINIELRNDQSLWLKDGAATAVKVSRDELVARVLERQEKNPNQAVVIAAAGSTRYQSVMDILDVLQRSGVQKVGLLARPQP